METLVNHTDPELITLLKEGHEEAFDEIYRRYWKILFNEAQKRLGDLDLAQEVVQNVFIDLWTHRYSRNIEQLRLYLSTAVRYQVFLVYKKERNNSRFEVPLEQIPSTATTVDSPLFLSELLAVIHAWLTIQPEKRREIFRLRYIEEFSTKEIANVLNISQKTVQNQLIIGHGSLKEAISKLLTVSLLCMHY